MKSCCISISHTNNIGGYLVSLGGSYGFDLENKQITKKVCSRLDTMEDSKFFVENNIKNFYWSAKEASFKAISNHLGKNILISKIYIKKLFLTNKFLSYTFESVLGPKIFGEGVTNTILDYTFSVARVKKPQKPLLIQC